jgi:hypothetical protein
MRLAEIKNGRLAMIAISGFALQEYISKVGVIDQTPAFFYPFSILYDLQGMLIKLIDQLPKFDGFLTS